MISINNVSFSYEKQKIIGGLSTEFSENKTYCIMGRSGVGKTTLLNIISGLLAPNSGTVSGTDSKKKSFIFQENRLIPWLSVYDNIKYVTENEEMINKSLRDTSLWECRNKLPSELSGGMERRAAIARADAFGGDMFFIDEPLYGLDVKTSEEILSLIKNAVKNTTAFIVTHSPEEAFFLADKIVFLKESPVKEAEIKDISEFKTPDDIKSFLL